MDVKTAFLNDIIEEEVYIEKPEGFIIHGSDSHVCQLKTAMYGLKQVASVVFQDRQLSLEIGLYQE